MNARLPQDVRAAAALAISGVLQQEASLASLIPDFQRKVPEKDRTLFKDLCFGTLRWEPRLNLFVKKLVPKPIKTKDSDIQALLLIGLYQLIYTRVPDHAAISATAEAAKHLRKDWACKLINGVLRRFVEERQKLETKLNGNPCFASAHPEWLLQRVRKAWPNDYREVLKANNEHPPFTLRINQLQNNRPDYLKQLEEAEFPAKATPFSPQGITLDEAVAVTRLPYWDEGDLSVQDEAAQLAAGLLDLAPGQRVLDACCAPGGKTCHILESEQELEEVQALDVDERRLARVLENLERLELSADIICGDGTDTGSWWDGLAYDRILLDAPCSATGVLRRHPDIKLLRRDDDIAELATLQRELLDALWYTLKPGGILIYATCSVLPQENSELVSQFISDTDDAEEIVLDVPWGIAQEAGRQLLPQIAGHDGFFYAKLRKLG